MVNPLLLAPSLLAGNHADLARSLAHTESIDGISWIHLDIMDGHFVPNLSFGPQTVADLRPNSKLFFDTHLMLSEPNRYVEAFAKAGSQNITIHVEPDYPVKETLQAIRSLGCQCGISLNPPTPIDAARPYLEDIDLILIMTVHPGFGGQSFIDTQLQKIMTLAQWREQGNFSWRIQVDGGINQETAKSCLKAGADTLVAGTSFFKAEDKAAFLKSCLTL